VAFVALFFALGGGALAATKAITVGSPASGDLTGTYPSPTIAPGKVTTSDFASGATAPNASELGGASPSDYGAVLSGRVNGLTTNTGGTGDFGAASGTSTAASGVDDSGVSTLSPAHDLVARDLSVKLTASPGGNWQRHIFLLVNGSVSDVNGHHLECIMSVFNSSSTACTASGPMLVPAGSTISIVDVPSCASPPCDGSPAAADARFAFRLTNS
jgi:hypothetical protein